MENPNEVLEKEMEETSLSHVLADLSAICAAKAEHVRCNWQDTTLAREWDKYARMVDTLASKVNL